MRSVPFLLAIAAVAFAGCSESGMVQTPVDDAIDSCVVDRGLLVASQVLDRPGDACREWVEMVHGRAARIVSGSGSVWSRRTRHGTGILTTAAHVITVCVGGKDCPEALHDPKRREGSALVKIAAAGAGFPPPVWSAHFPLYNPFTPADQVGSTSILPRHDVSVFVIDPQTFADNGTSVAIQPGPLLDSLLPLHDPDGVTTTPPTWALAEPGDRVMLAGFTNVAESLIGELHVSVGRVLSDVEARHAIEQLSAAGDEEGGIAYDAEAEFLLEGHAVFGMSGAGVFDELGRQVGVVVRASFADIGVQYVRAVRMTYIVSRIQTTFAGLPQADREAVRPYLEVH